MQQMSLVHTGCYKRDQSTYSKQMSSLKFVAFSHNSGRNFHTKNLLEWRQKPYHSSLITLCFGLAMTVTWCPLYFRLMRSIKNSPSSSAQRQLTSAHYCSKYGQETMASVSYTGSNGHSTYRHIRVCWSTNTDKPLELDTPTHILRKEFIAENFPK